jgi:hypothetical protein
VLPTIGTLFLLNAISAGVVGLLAPVAVASLVRAAPRRGGALTSAR